MHSPTNCYKVHHIPKCRRSNVTLSPVRNNMPRRPTCSFQIHSDFRTERIHSSNFRPRHPDSGICIELISGMRTRTGLPCISHADLRSNGAAWYIFKADFKGESNGFVLSSVVKFFIKLHNNVITNLLGADQPHPNVNVVRAWLECPPKRKPSIRNSIGILLREIKRHPQDLLRLGGDCGKSRNFCKIMYNSLGGIGVHFQKWMSGAMVASGFRVPWI